VTDRTIPIVTITSAQPRWSRDGTKLFYIVPDQKLMAVSLDPGSGRAGALTILFQTRIVQRSMIALAPSKRISLILPSITARLGRVQVVGPIIPRLVRISVGEQSRASPSQVIARIRQVIQKS